MNLSPRQTLDAKQLELLIHYMVGETAIGVCNDDEVTVPISPSLRAFLFGLLGEICPQDAFRALQFPRKGLALAGLFRAAAEALELKHAGKV